MEKEVDEIDMCAWSDAAVVAKEVVATPILQPAHIEVTYDGNNSFIDAYNGCIKKAWDLITGQ